MVSPNDDRQRFEEVYRATYPLVTSYCRRRLQEDDASEAVSRIFTVAWQKRSQLLQASEPLAWLYRVSFNTISSMYRSKKSLRRRVENLAREQRTHVPGADEMIGLEDDLSRALEAVATLSPGDQEVIRLAAFEELSYAEIGEVLGISAGAARSKLYRARKELRTAFRIPGAGGTP